MLSQTSSDENNTDIAVLTETWLWDSLADKAWLQGYELNNNGYHIDTVNRNNRKGGGIAIVHKESIKVKVVCKGDKGSFEYGIWKASMKSVTVTVIAIYRPPRSILLL